jgi:protein-tyrosine phosphatase
MQKGGTLSAIWVPRWIRQAGKLVLVPRVRQDALWEWRRRRRGMPALPSGSIRNVLVLCYGNLCRSPFAGVLLAANRCDLSIRSAGLNAKEGNPADGSALRVSRQFDVDLGDHRTHRVSSEDLAWSHLVLVMEGHQVAGVRRLGAEHTQKTYLLGDFLPTPPHRIEDPWGRGDEVFEATFAKIVHALAQLSRLLPPEKP